MKKLNIILFYKFHKIKDPEAFAREQRILCKELGVMGKVLIAKEGINGSISGTKKQTEKYKEYLKKKEGFSDIVFKEENGNEHPFTKMIVRVRKEIVSIKKKVDMSKSGKHISPKEFLALYNKNDKNLVILDARNDYEWKIGKFKEALNSNIKTFREFPDFVKKFAKNKENKKKKIVMYCTGGIRCEKASAYMIEKGFEDVSQLDGGIINFCQQYPNTVWEGKCFVFDKRLMSDINQKENDLASCEVCGGKCDLYRNCRNVDCDKLVVMCVNCQRDMNGCCSDSCLIEFRKQCLEKSRRKQRVKVLHNKA